MHFDLAILGSGFSGSLLAMVARRLGLSVLLLERGTHPRFAIGESTSPLTNLLLEELATEYDLPRLLPLAAYGTWKRAYPEVGVGLKRGFTFYHHRAGEPFRTRPERDNELMVAASPNDEVADTHWYRADFDHFLLREAQDLGVEYLDRFTLTRAVPGEPGELEGTRDGKELRFRARYIVDATGPRGALSRLLGLPSSPPYPTYPGTQTLFSHFTGVNHFSEVVGPRDETQPYPPDAAALHHTFDGGWIWVLRFDNGITSAGIAAEDWLAEELGLAEGAPAWGRVLARFPSVRDHFAGSEAVLPWVYAPRLAYRCRMPQGPGFALLPSAMGFVDPLFSTGFPLTLLGIHRIARALRDYDGVMPYCGENDYAYRSTRELTDTALLVQSCYRTFKDFPSFTALSMIYFAAASYSEMARRLGRPDLAGQFLVGSRPQFTSILTGAAGAAAEGRPVSLLTLGEQLEPFNIAGLCDPEKRNWYGVDLEDVVRGAAKLEQTPEQVRAFIARMGW